MTTHTVHDLPLVKLYHHPHNPRKTLGDLTDLTTSVQEHGVLQPITVVPTTGTDGEHTIVMGHRRAEAARLAGLPTVPAIIDPDLTESQQIIMMGHENIQRSQLTPVEEADWVQDLLDVGHIKRSNLSRVTGMPKSTITARLKLANLPTPIKDKVHTGQATLEDALALADPDLPAEAVEDLTGKLGTGAFRWGIEQARRDATAEKARATVFAALAEVGVTRVDTPVDVATYVFAFRLDSPDALTNHEVVAGSVALAGHWGAEVTVYRPRTAEEAAEFAEATAAREVRDATPEPGPSWEERQEAVRALVGPLNIARALRVEFLGPFMSGAKLLTPGQSIAVFDELVFGIGEGWELDDVFGWLDLGRDVPLTVQQKHALVLTPEGRDRLALAALAATGEGAPDVEHESPHDACGVFSAWKTAEGWGGHDSIQRWYALLEHLGYVPSEWETGQLHEGLPDADDVDGDAGVDGVE